MKTINWAIDAKIDGTIIADEFMYNDSGNELVNIGDFTDGLIEVLMNNLGERKVYKIDDLAIWINIAVAAYATGAISTEQHWGTLTLEKL